LDCAAATACIALIDMPFCLPSEILSYSQLPEMEIRRFIL
jgi:hypothetical protein